MISIVKDDITRLDVEAIVNAANSSLLGGGGVDGAIHSAAGPELRKYNRTLNGCRTGEAKISPGFNLKADWVISTVGPVWQGGNSNEADLLADCYRNCLKLALQKNISSIAFPAISTGIYAYPLKEAAQIALSIMRQYENDLSQIIACCFSDEDFQVYEKINHQLIK